MRQENPKKTIKPISELLEFSIINIDKPSGPTSFQTSDFIRRKLGLKKTAHFGTLDPKVTGVLPVALNRACKLTGFFLGHDKTYVGTMHINNEVTSKKLQEIINKKFIGKIKQLPPKKSRVKREIREREIKKFELIEQKGKDFLFLAEVQGGTYIRKLIHDLGLEKEIGGAHMTELRRIRAGIFKENDKNFVNLYEFEKAVEEFEKGKEEKLREILTPAEDAILKTMPFVKLSEKADIKHILAGSPLFSKDVVKLSDSEIFAVFQDNKFIGIYKKTEEEVKKENTEIIAKPMFVFN